MSSSKRRRKVQGMQEANDLPPKKIKKEADSCETDNDSKGSSNVFPTWEYESGMNKWTPYTFYQIKEISRAFYSGKESIEITQNKAVVIIVFVRMVQRNSQSGFEKRVRCLSSIDDEAYLWQWKESKEKWATYPYSIISLLEAARAHNLSIIAWKDQGQQVTVDLDKLTLSKEGNRNAKNVRRILADEIDLQQMSNSAKSKSRPSKVKTQPVVKKVKTEAILIEEAPSKIKSLVFEGKAPVDLHCPVKDKVHVYCEGSDIWDVMLNQTNVQNNNNKYYRIQLLEDNLLKTYYVWMRWGRVGFNGQNTLQTCGANLDQAKNIFTKKFSDKTKNVWEERQSFVKIPGKYDLLIMDYKTQGEIDTATLKEEKHVVVPSKLDSRIQALIKLICNVQAMEEMLKEMKYDTNKAPLGKLTTDQIRAGYEALRDIESCINNKDYGKKLVKACNEFYTRIPHCFGMKRPPLITSPEEFKIKIQLLDALGDIQIAVSMIKEELIDKGNPVDQHYKSLQCDMTPLDHTHAEFELVEKYLINTHAKTHNQYNLELVNVFVLRHHNTEFKDVGNRMLLWHGSRLTNWAGIIRQGLRIAPPEAPVTGYMFGKGIYFADISSKSANYCFATQSKNTGLLLLSEVSLGKINELLAADYNADNLPQGFHSVKGLGKVAPDPDENITMCDGVVVPTGKCTDTDVINHSGYTLNYNEYIVYNTNQVRMRYLVQVKFNFK